MCAPYSAIKDYKFKVKLTPGSTKAGAACNTAVNIFKRHADTTPQEKDLLSTLSDSECLLQMMGNVKLSVPGMAALNSSKKKQKKQKKK